MFSTPVWPTATSSENVTVYDSQPTDDGDDQHEVFNESQAADDGCTPLVKLTDSYEV